MYVTGTRLTFSTRLHQLDGDSAALTSFLTEGNSYVSTVPRQLSGQWEREARKQQYCFSGVSGLLTNQFSSSVILPDAGRSDMVDAIYNFPMNFEFYFDTANVGTQTTLHLWVSTAPNSNGGSFAADMTAVRGDNEYFDNASTNPALTPNGEGDYYYFTKAYGDGVSYSTNAVTGTVVGPVHVTF